MCGRYSLTRRQAEVIERFSVEELIGESHPHPRFNIAPTQMVPVIINQAGHRVLCQFKWGLIPFWTKDPKKTKPVINARSETMASKAFFKQALSKRRCLIPADGFYEWRHQNKEKIPMYINLNDHELFAFAGLWNQWTSPEGDVLRTCTIITRAANDAMSSVHDRMPVIVRPEHEVLWLDPEVNDPERLIEVLEAVPNEAIKMFEVSRQVNSAARDSADMVEPVPVQPTLFEVKP